MDIITLMIFAAFVVIVPLALFFGLIGLGVLIWSLKRIGPYFVGLGRWSADWRNYIPCGCLVFLTILVFLVTAALLPPEFDILRYAILVFVLLIGSVLTMFALVAWTLRLSAWVWPRFRREFWRSLQRVSDLVLTGVSGEGRARDARSAGRRQPRRKTAVAKEPAEGRVGLPAVPAATATSRAPRVRRSWLDLSWLWGLVWGKPEQTARKPGPAGRATGAHVQKQAAAGEAAAMPRVPTRPRSGIRPLLWRLRLPSPGSRTRRPVPVGKPKAGMPMDITETPARTAAPDPPMLGQPRPGVTAPAAKPEEAKRKATVVVRAEPKRGVPGVSGGVGTSVVGALQDLRKGFWMGIFWAVRRARSGIDLMRHVLHLGGKRTR